MLGAIIGDIVGSRFEWNNIKTKEFEFFTDKCFFTDDSVMTIAVADALMKSKDNPDRLSECAVQSMQSIGRPYPDCGYGGSFYHWIYSDNP
ncbi:MAG: restriction endonuclease subunit M, partial [Oscillospiraceae bacterium]|nr:restriction endonuclease subunit M [Oscillospiraceae bacterium]